MIEGYSLGDAATPSYRFGDPPGRKPMPFRVRESILRWWEQGYSARQIRQRMRGRIYQTDAIYKVVMAARDEGDPRAVRRR